MTEIATQLTQPTTGIWHCPDTGEYCFSDTSTTYAKSKQPHPHTWHRLSGSAGEWRERMIKEDDAKRGIHTKKFRHCDSCPLKVSTETSDCEQIMRDHVNDHFGDHAFGEEIIVTAQTCFICKECGSGAGTKNGSDLHQTLTGHTKTEQVSLITRS